MRYIFIISFFTSLIFANTAQKLAENLNLYAGTKAIIQWERVFSSNRRMSKYKIDMLNSQDIKKLKQYLIKHAADSDHPVVPGL